MDANPDVDLVTLAQVMEWMSTSQSVESEDNLQACISSASVYWLWRTGNGNPDGSVPAKSPLVQQVDFTEWRDGNGSNRIFTRHTPIASATTVQVDGVNIQSSSGSLVSGWVIDGSGKSIALRGSWRFTEGIQNVYLAYKAGFSSVPADIQVACMQMIALNFKKRNWVGQQQVIQPETFGTVMYRDWSIPPEADAVIRAYTRRAI